MQGIVAEPTPSNGLAAWFLAFPCPAYPACPSVATKVSISIIAVYTHKAYLHLSICMRIETLDALGRRCQVTCAEARGQ